MRYRLIALPLIAGTLACAGDQRSDDDNATSISSAGPGSADDGTSAGPSDDGSSTGDDGSGPGPGSNGSNSGPPPDVGDSGEPPAGCDQPPPSAGDETLIDDLEPHGGEIEPSASIPPLDGRRGFWFTYNDGTPGGTQDPPVMEEFVPSEGGADGRGHAARMQGSGFSTWGAGMGVKLNDDFESSCAYDGSTYGGIIFWARGNVTVRVSLGTLATAATENGGQCVPMGDTGCSDHFGRSFALTDTWQEYVVNFSDVAQGGWGVQAQFNPATLLEIQWQVAQNQPFDVWVDDLHWWSG